jgi:hypothetical protein
LVGTDGSVHEQIGRFSSLPRAGCSQTTGSAYADFIVVVNDPDIASDNKRDLRALKFEAGFKDLLLLELRR